MDPGRQRLAHGSHPKAEGASSFTCERANAVAEVVEISELSKLHTSKYQGDVSCPPIRMFMCVCTVNFVGSAGMGNLYLFQCWYEGKKQAKGLVCLKDQLS